MADNQTQFEKLYGLLHNPDNKELQPERQELDNILNSRDFSSHQDMVGAVASLARSVNEKVPFGFDEQSFDFNPDTYIQQTQPSLQEQETVQQAESLTTSPRETHHNEQNISRGLPDTATPALHSLQEQQLLEEFDKILASNNPEEIRRFLDTRLEAPDLLKDQWRIANQYIEQINDPRIDKEQALQLLAKQHQQQLDKLKHAQPTEADKNAQAKAQQLKDSIIRAANVNDKRTAVRELVRHQIARTEPYSFFVFYENPQAGVAIMNAIANLLRAQAAMQENAAQQEAFAQDQEEASLQRQQAINQQTAAGAGQAARGAATKAAGKAIRVGTGAIAKALGPEAVVAEKIGWWIWGFIKKHKFITAGIVAFIVVVALMPLIVLIVLVVSLFGGNNAQQGVQTQLTPTCSPTSDCVAKLQALGITVSFAPKYSFNPDNKIQETYNSIAFVSQSPSQFLQLLKLPQQPIQIVYHNGGCAGHASSNGTVDLYGNCLTDTNRFVLVHELGHEIAFRNPSLYQKFLNQFSGVLHFINPLVLPTYNCQFDYGIGPFPAECFADMIGEYPVYHTYRNTVSILGVSSPIYVEGRAFTTYPNFYSGNYYNFAKNNIFGGLTF